MLNVVMIDSMRCRRDEGKAVLPFGGNIVGARAHHR